MNIDGIDLKAPFPYFGGKGQIADTVWKILGKCDTYIEPFFGSGAVLWNRPDWTPGMHEIVNDKSGHIANVWRSLKADPDKVAEICDFPVNHAELTARRLYMRDHEEELEKNLVENIDYFDPRMAGYFIWVTSCCIGVWNQSMDTRPHIMGTHGLSAIHGELSDDLPPKKERIYDFMRAMCKRLRDVMVVCGDYKQVLGGNWQVKDGHCGIFFDPPYGDSRRSNKIYLKDSYTVAQEVLEYCLKKGDDRRFRIVLCGYDTEHDELLSHGWRKMNWKANGGFANFGKDHKENAGLEMLWTSPGCLNYGIQNKLF